MNISETIKTPIEWSELAEGFLDADGNIFRANQIADALNTTTAREAQLVEALESTVQASSPRYIRLENASAALVYIWEVAAKALAEHRGE